MIRMAMVQESWKPLSPLIQSCVNDQLRPNGESIQSLIANGVMANDPRVQPFISKCQQIAAVAGAWRKMDGDTKSCLARLLQANNQSVSTLAEMGVGPADPQVLPLITQCQQIDATRKSWASLDPYVNTCVDRFLKNGGQSIETLASERIAPADPQAAPVMAKCQGISSQSLMKNISCSIDGAPSRCDEFYVLETAQTSPLGIDQLVTALIAGESVGKAQLELPGPKAARLARIAERRKGMIAEGALKKLGGLLDPANKFAFAKASGLRKQIEAQRANPKFSEQDLLELDASATAMLSSNNAEIERLRIQREEMLSRGELPVTGEGSGSSEKSARIDAYYQTFEKQLRDYIAGQADGDIGKQFKASATEDFEKFRSNFFLGAPSETCRKAGRAYACSIEGVFKLGTLKSEVQRIMSATVSSPGQSYRFILGYQETDNEATRYLIDSIRAEFVNSGFKVIARGAQEQAEASGAFDYYLNILDISYDDGQSDIGSVGGAGSNVFENYVLKARIKLLDNKKDPSARQELANIPVLNTKRLPRDTQMPKEARRSQLLPMQATELARQVYRDINARLLTIAAPQGGTPASDEHVKLAGQYSVKIMGLTERDREKIRALRNAVTKVLPGTETTVDPGGTNDKSVEIRFEHPDKFDPEDVVDAIYEVFKDHKKTFKARYEGNNSFAGSL